MSNSPNFLKLHDLRSEDFNQIVSDYCTLNILINKNRLCFCVVNVKQNVVALGDYIVDKLISSRPNFTVDDLKLIFNTEPLLTKTYESINVAYQSRYHCSVATELLTEENRQKTFELCVPPLTNSEAFSIEQSPLGKKNQVLFAFPKTIEALLCEKLNGDFSVISAYASYANSVELENSIFSGRKLYINFYENVADLLIINSGKMLFANTFSFSNDKDSEFLYYILSVGKMYNFKFEEEPVIISGFYNSESSLFTKLMDYAHKQELIPEPSNVLLVPELFNISNHHYYNLYCIQ